MIPFWLMTQVATFAPASGGGGGGASAGQLTGFLMLITRA